MSKSNVGSHPEYPKKPLNAYFRFVAQNKDSLKGVDGYRDKIKAMWENFDPKKKAEYEKDYKEKMEQFKEDVATWQNKYGQKEKKAKSTGKEISKPEKEKGAKGKNANEEAKGKKVEESDARKASKSKGKDQGKPGRSKK